MSRTRSYHHITTAAAVSASTSAAALVSSSSSSLLQYLVASTLPVVVLSNDAMSVLMENSSFSSLFNARFLDCCREVKKVQEHLLRRQEGRIEIEMELRQGRYEVISWDVRLIDQPTSTCTVRCPAGVSIVLTAIPLHDPIFSCSPSSSTTLPTLAEAASCTFPLPSLQLFGDRSTIPAAASPKIEPILSISTPDSIYTRLSSTIDSVPHADPIDPLSISSSHPHPVVSNLCFRRLAERMPVALFWTNAKFEMKWRNQKWASLGCAATSLDDFVHKEDLEMVARWAKNLVVQEIDGEIEFRWKSLDQNQWCYMVVTVDRDAAGALLGFVGIISNRTISRLKKVETVVREERLRSAQRQHELEELALLSESSSVGLARIDLTGNFLSVNKAWHKLCKLKNPALLNSWVDNLDPRDHERVMTKWTKALKDLTPISTQFRWIDGTVALVQAVPNNSDVTLASGWIGSVVENTSQYEDEQNLRELLEERSKDAEIAREQKRQQEILVDVVSHEIRSPISSIVQNAELTRSSLVDLRTLLESSCCGSDSATILANLSQDIASLDSISECAHSQKRVADDILGLAAMQLEKYDVIPIVVDLPQRLRTVLRIYYSECRSKGIDLELKLGESMSKLGTAALAKFDPVRLSQILVNLLSNAIRFVVQSQVRKVTLAVDLSSKAPIEGASYQFLSSGTHSERFEPDSPIYLYFRVDDTGPGLKKCEADHLFKYLSQASPLTHTTHAGSGLGLWITRKLSQLMNGGIELESQFGEGSSFRGYLQISTVGIEMMDVDLKQLSPLHPSASCSTIARSPPYSGSPISIAPLPLQHGSASATIVSTSLAPLRILCCEDNHISRTVLVRQLSKHGHSVELAEDGQEGLDKIFALDSSVASRYDVVLMDIELPKVNGLEATRRVRDAGIVGIDGQRLRIVALTGNARQGQVEAAFSAGVDAVVTKPYQLADLLNNLRSSIT